MVYRVSVRRSCHAPLQPRNLHANSRPNATHRPPSSPAPPTARHHTSHRLRQLCPSAIPCYHTVRQLPTLPSPPPPRPPPADSAAMPSVQLCHTANAYSRPIPTPIPAPTHVPPPPAAPLARWLPAAWPALRFAWGPAPAAHGSAAGRRGRAKGDRGVRPVGKGHGTRSTTGMWRQVLGSTCRCCGDRKARAAARSMGQGTGLTWHGGWVAGPVARGSDCKQSKGEGQCNLVQHGKLEPDSLRESRGFRTVTLLSLCAVAPPAPCSPRPPRASAPRWPPAWSRTCACTPCTCRAAPARRSPALPCGGSGLDSARQERTRGRTGGRPAYRYRGGCGGQAAACMRALLDC